MTVSPDGVGNDRRPSSIDVHVGQQIRRLRKQMGVSQERLAEALGLTFQQVQKYERGSNRVSASKLFEIARFMHVPVGEFYDGLAAQTAAVHEESAPFEHDHAPLSPEAREIAVAFSRIRQPALRKKVAEFIQSLSEQA